MRSRYRQTAADVPCVLQHVNSVCVHRQLLHCVARTSLSNHGKRQAFKVHVGCTMADACL